MVEIVLIISPFAVYFSDILLLFLPRGLYNMPNQLNKQRSQMEAINRQSRTSVHFSINYVIAIGWTPDKALTVDFQKALLDNGLEFSQTNVGPRNFTLSRTQPSHLQVKLDSPAPQVSGIHIISAPPAYDLEMFTQEASAATAAYQQVYPAQQYQIIRCAAKIQHLYSSQEHAFQYLWETRLGQSPEDFLCLGQRPVAGGGLRLIMPPHATPGAEPCSIELRIESSFREPRKLLIETAFVWPKPLLLQSDEKFDPGRRLSDLEQYATNEVWTFLTQTKAD
jgi:hypothetical protein